MIITAIVATALAAAYVTLSIILTEMDRAERRSEER